MSESSEMVNQMLMACEQMSGTRDTQPRTAKRNDQFLAYRAIDEAAFILERIKALFISAGWGLR
jgi:hypothetical protein